MIGCQALSPNGKRCCKGPVKRFEYHGDNEIYSGFEKDSPTWVAVQLCRKHAEGSRHDWTKRKKENSKP